MTCIAKKELIFVPGFGTAGYLGGLVFINRNGKEGKQKMSNAMQELKKNNIKLWVFPEGTRRNTGMIHDFKKGAFHTAIQEDINIVPVVFSSYKKFLDKEKKFFEDGEIIIKALPEVSTKGLKISDIDNLMFKIRSDMTEVYHEITKEANKNIFNYFFF
jgi:lysophosphatidate acyltransferase